MRHTEPLSLPHGASNRARLQGHPPCEAPGAVPVTLGGRNSQTGRRAEALGAGRADTGCRPATGHGHQCERSRRRWSSTVHTRLCSAPHAASTGVHSAGPRGARHGASVWGRGPHRLTHAPVCTLRHSHSRVHETHHVQPVHAHTRRVHAHPRGHPRVRTRGGAAGKADTPSAQGTEGRHAHGELRPCSVLER